jgi:hypothetical protein
MSVRPAGGVTGTLALRQPTAAQIAAATAPATSTIAAQTAPTVDAAQAWEDAMRAAMGDESAAGPSQNPSSIVNGQTGAATTAATAGQTGAATAGQPSAATPALTPQALAALVSGSSSAAVEPLVTSLSAPTGATTPTSDASAGSFA